MRRLTLVLAVALALAGPPASRAEKVDDPSLKDAQVGDWIAYKMESPGSPVVVTTKQTISAVTTDEVTIEMESAMTMGGKPMPTQKAPPVKRPRKIEKVSADRMKPATGTSEANEKIQAADGKPYACTVYTTQVSGKKAKSYVCKELPLGGLVRTELDGKVTMEMTGWGRGK